jgi:hypothetical protein
MQVVACRLSARGRSRIIAAMKNILREAQGRVRNGWKALAFVLLLALITIPLILALHHLPSAAKAWVPGMTLIAGSVLLVSWICVRAEGTTLAGIGWNPGWRAGGQLLVGLAIGIGTLLLEALLVWLGNGVHFASAPPLPWDKLLHEAGKWLAVGVMEELTFRGYAMQRAIRGMGVRGGMALFGVLFCVAHPLDGSMSAPVMVLAMINTFLYAVTMSVVWYRTGSLAVPIGWHMGWNWAQQTLGFGVSGIATAGLWTVQFTGAPDWLTGGAYGLEASLVDTVLGAAILLALVAWRPRRRLPARGGAGAVPA